MGYSIEIVQFEKLAAATMKMTIPDYSTDLALRAVKTLEKELERKGIEQFEPKYNFLIQYDSEYRLEVIDVEVFVSVKQKGKDSDMVKFIDLPNREKIIRVTTDRFEDIHIALAEWMHDNNYVADGGLRMVIHEGTEFICDCPVRPAED